MRHYDTHDMIDDAVEKATLNLKAQLAGAIRERDQTRQELEQRDSTIRSMQRELADLRRLVDLAGAKSEPGAARW